MLPHHLQIGHLLTLLTVINIIETTLPLPSLSDYKSAMKLSLLFYEAQRSGHLPKSNRIQWRADSALNDRGLHGEDLSGGYYDASDFVKFSFTMAFTTTLLAWGMVTYKQAYIDAGAYEQGVEAVKWSTDYFIKCHTKPFELYGQVGDFQLDHEFWGRPEDLNMTRPPYKIDIEHPGSDLAGEVSAALSSASLLFLDANQTYAKELTMHATQLYEFATIHRGLYHDAIPGARIYYESAGYGDELTWAAIWLYRATQHPNYIEQAESFYMKFRINDRPNEFFYNKKAAGVQLLLAQLTQRVEYRMAVRNFCDYALHQQSRTPAGLIFIDNFGTLSHAANVAFICLQAATLYNNTDNSSEYLTFAKQQIDYMLGANNDERSYVIGFGTNYPKQPHHSASSCPTKPEPCGWKQFNAKTSNPQILYGALVSGPNQIDNYEDVREEFLYNEVTLDYNAGFQGTLAGLIQHHQNIEEKKMV